MRKRERLEKTIAGEATDRAPVALWRHWPGDDQHPADLARAIVDFQKRWDWDFVKVTPASSYCLVDYGVEDRWVGHLEGTRDYTKSVVQEPADWTKLPRLDPTAGGLGMHLETLRLVREGVGDDVPIIHTIFNPLAQAKHIAGRDDVIRHLRRYPDMLKTGLATIADNMVRYLEALRTQTRIDGIFYAIQHASYGLLNEDEYREFGRPYDLQILEALGESWWFNLLHLHGADPMFDLVTDYPVQAINWHDRETPPMLAEGQARFDGAVCGGLGRWDAAHNGTPDEVRAQARDALEQTGGRRFILSTGCVLITTSPTSNVRAVRESV